MDTLRNFDYQRKVAFYDLTKCYYGKYPFKIIVNTKTLFPAGWTNRDTLKKAVLGLCTGIDDVKLRNDYGTMSIFVRTEADVLTYLTNDANNPKHVISITCPRGEAELALVMMDHKVRLRKALYWGRYRWCVSLKPHRIVRMTDLRKWFNEVHSLDNEAPDYRDRVMWDSGWPQRVFLAQDSDVFMLKMAHNEVITGIEKAVLHHEVENASDAS